MVADSLQYVDEVGGRIDPMQPASSEQTLHDADPFGAPFSPTKQPLLAPHWNDAQRALKRVGVHGDGGVFPIDAQGPARASWRI
jgi:hypothetical protein